MSIIIWISIGVFLLIPYYLSIFLLNRKMVKRHILQWLIFHGVFAGIEFLVCSEWFNMATIILISCVLYYFFSYIFYGHDIQKKVKKESMYRIINHKMFLRVSIWVLGFALLLVIVDFILIFSAFAKISSLFEQIYLSSTILISFFQCVYYYRKLKNTYGINKAY